MQLAMYDAYLATVITFSLLYFYFYMAKTGLDTFPNTFADFEVKETLNQIPFQVATSKELVSQPSVFPDLIRLSSLLGLERPVPPSAIPSDSDTDPLFRSKPCTDYTLDDDAHIRSSCLYWFANDLFAFGSTHYRYSSLDTYIFASGQWFFESGNWTYVYSVEWTNRKLREKNRKLLLEPQKPLGPVEPLGREWDGLKAMSGLDYLPVNGTGMLRCEVASGMCTNWSSELDAYYAKKEHEVALATKQLLLQ